MPAVGFHASHEQLPPSELLDAVRLAQSAGFTAAMSSDHFTPWSARQGESGFAWSWLGAAMQATALPFGVVTAPGQRYHPAIVAQAIATLAEMAPGRLWVALGSGEASNEHITGDRWPDKAARNERLLECVHVIRALLAGEEVSLDGHVRVDRARLWTLPVEPPPLVGAALTPETAAWVAGWADALVTIHQPPDVLGRLIDAFRDQGGENKPVYVQCHLSWAPDEDEALRIAHDQWRTNVFPSPLMADLERVDQFEMAAAHVRPEDVRSAVLVSDDTGRHLAWLREVLDAGAEGVYLHHVGKEQRPFIETFGEKVLPELLS
ncbi:MAG: TIGR03885 family FMN-dependent LLM class oxidoreductase [Acidimicrobiales bacterium]